MSKQNAAWKAYEAKEQMAKNKNWPYVDERYIAGYGKLAMRRA